MSAGLQQSMFFLGLPDLKRLVCITVTLQEEDEELRSKQIKTCRELVLLYSDILASPALDSFTEITVVMAIQFFQTGILQVFGQRRSLQLGSPQCVFPGVLQCCLSYSLITRLAPSWNKAGLYLIAGKDFLCESGRLDAVSMELSTSEGQLCISIEANTVRLPPTSLEDFDLPPLVLRRFCSDPDCVLDPSSTGGAIWCHILPSMKKGQIITISRKLPRDGPFRTYRDLQNHWSCLYGYRLPELAEEEVVYCSVYFRLVGERLFTYPLSCIRLQPVQRCLRVHLQGALGSFLSDIRDRLQSVCGFPARLTGKPCYRTVGLNTAAAVQVLSGEQVNLTTSSSSSIRPALTQHPPPPPPPRPRKAPFSQQDRAQGILGNGCGFRSSLTQRQGCRGDRDWPSSSSSSSPRVSFSFSDSSGYQSAPSISSSSSSSLPLLQPTSSLSSSSSSSLPLLQPASSLSSSSSSSLPLLQPASSLTSSSFSSSSSLPLLQLASSLSSSSSSSLPLLQPASSLTSSSFSSSSSLPLLQPASSLSSSSSSSLPLLQPASSLTSSSFSSSSSLPLLQPASSLSSSSSSSLPLLQPASSLTSSSFSSSSSLPLLQLASSLSSSSSSLSLLQAASSFSSSSFLPLFQPASSLTTSSFSLPPSSSVLSPLPPPSQTPVISAPKLVPIFKNKCPSRHINIALLRVQKQKEQLGRGEEDKRRVTLPAFRKKTPTTASSSVSSLSAASFPIHPPPIIPRFSCCNKPRGSAALQPTDHPKLAHLNNISSAPESKPENIPKLEIKFKSRSCLKTNRKQRSESKTAPDEVQEQPSAAPPLTSPDVSNKDSSTTTTIATTNSRAGVVFTSKPKKSRSAVRDVNVEKMARSNQLSKLNSATLLAWLRGRGAHVSAKNRKEELILKVMGCLAEA